MKQVVVTAAILQRQGDVLLARRGPGRSLEGYWEFPGGKIETGETPESCLAREVHEELGLCIAVNELFCDTTYTYDHASIRLVAYRAEVRSGTPKASEHSAVEWVPIRKLRHYKLAPADIPIAEKLIRGERGDELLVGESKSDV